MAKSSGAPPAHELSPQCALVLSFFFPRAFMRPLNYCTISRKVKRLARDTLQPPSSLDGYSTPKSLERPPPSSRRPLHLPATADIRGGPYLALDDDSRPGALHRIQPLFFQVKANPAAPGTTISLARAGPSPSFHGGRRPVPPCVDSCPHAHGETRE